jgi:hypothetical protein
MSVEKSTIFCPTNDEFGRLAASRAQCADHVIQSIGRGDLGKDYVYLDGTRLEAREIDRERFRRRRGG